LTFDHACDVSNVVLFVLYRMNGNTKWIRCLLLYSTGRCWQTGWTCERQRYAQCCCYCSSIIPGQELLGQTCDLWSFIVSWPASRELASSERNAWRRGTDNECGNFNIMRHKDRYVLVIHIIPAWVCIRRVVVLIVLVW